MNSGMTGWGRKKGGSARLDSEVRALVLSTWGGLVGGGMEGRRWDVPARVESALDSAPLIALVSIIDRQWQHYFLTLKEKPSKNNELKTE